MSIVAWIKRDPTSPDLACSCQAVAGMWGEHGRRRYCLFLGLRILDSAAQVRAYISRTGGPTPGYKYCMDTALGATPVPFSTWLCVAVTYDSAPARAYLGGIGATHEAAAAFRVTPIAMAIGQAGGVTAAMAARIEGGRVVAVAYDNVRSALLAQGAKLPS